MAVKYGKKVRELIVKEIQEIVEEKKGFIISSVEKIKASQIDGLRKKIRQNGSRHLTIKNKLAKIAFEQASISELAAITTEKKTLGVSVIEDDPVLVAKILKEFSKSNKGFDFASGYLEGCVLNRERVHELADMPSREQLIAMVVSMMNSPISKFVGVLSSVLRSILYALNAIKEQKEASGK